MIDQSGLCPLGIALFSSHTSTRTSPTSTCSTTTVVTTTDVASIVVGIVVGIVGIFVVVEHWAVGISHHRLLPLPLHLSLGLLLSQQDRLVPHSMWVVTGPVRVAIHHVPLTNGGERDVLTVVLETLAAPPLDGTTPTRQKTKK